MVWSGMGLHRHLVQLWVLAVHWYHRRFMLTFGTTPHTPTELEPSIDSTSEVGSWCSIITSAPCELGNVSALGRADVPCASAAVDWKSKFTRGVDLAVTDARAGRPPAPNEGPLHAGEEPGVRREIVEPVVLAAAALGAAAGCADFLPAAEAAVEARAHLGA